MIENTNDISGFKVTFKYDECIFNNGHIYDKETLTTIMNTSASSTLDDRGDIFLANIGFIVKDIVSPINRGQAIAIVKDAYPMLGGKGIEVEFKFVENINKSIVNTCVDLAEQGHLKCAPIGYGKSTKSGKIFPEYKLLAFQLIKTKGCYREGSGIVYGHNFTYSDQLIMEKEEDE